MNPHLDAIKAKYPLPPTCQEISGFGGAYEAQCVDLFYAALKTLEEIGYDCAAMEARGINTTRDFLATEEGKKVEAAMMIACNNDCTGAMFGASLSRAFYHYRHGHDAYVTAATDPKNN